MIPHRHRDFLCWVSLRPLNLGKHHPDRGSQCVCAVWSPFSLRFFGNSSLGWNWTYYYFFFFKRQVRSGEGHGGNWGGCLECVRADISGPRLVPIQGNPFVYWGCYCSCFSWEILQNLAGSVEQPLFTLSSASCWQELALGVLSLVSAVPTYKQCNA